MSYILSDGSVYSRRLPFKLPSASSPATPQGNFTVPLDLAAQTESITVIVPLIGGGTTTRGSNLPALLAYDVDSGGDGFRVVDSDGTTVLNYGLKPGPDYGPLGGVFATIGTYSQPSAGQSTFFFISNTKKDNLYRVTFQPPGGSTIDSAFSYGVTYFVVAVDVTGAIQLSTTPYGTPIVANGDGSGTLNIEAYQITQGVLRFKAPTVNSGADTNWYLYFKSSGVTNGENRSGAIDGSTLVFSPLEEDPSGTAPQELDWSSNAIHGTSNGGMVSGDLVSAQVGKGLEFEAANSEFVSFPLALSAHSQLTVSCLVKRNSNGSQYVFVGDVDAPVLYFDASDFPNFLFRTSSAVTGGSAITSSSGWHYLTGSFSDYPSQLVKLYVDGVLQGTFSYGYGNDNGVANGYLAGSASPFFDGIADEFRFDATERSADWIALDSNLKLSNDSNLVFGDLEVSPAGSIDEDSIFPFWQQSQQRVAFTVPRVFQEDEIASVTTILEQEDGPFYLMARCVPIPWRDAVFTDDEIGMPLANFFREQEDGPINLYARVVPVVWNAVVFNEDEIGSQLKNFFREQEDSTLDLFMRETTAPWKGVPFLDDETKNFVVVPASFDQEEPWIALRQVNINTGKMFVDDEIVPLMYLEQEEPWVAQRQIITNSGKVQLDDEILPLLGFDQEEPWIGQRQVIINSGRVFIDDETLPILFIEQEEHWKEIRQSVTWAIMSFIYNEELPVLPFDQEEPWIALRQQIYWVDVSFVYDEELPILLIDQEEPWIAQKQLNVNTGKVFVDDEIFAAISVEEEHSAKPVRHPFLWNSIAFVDSQEFPIAFEDDTSSVPLVRWPERNLVAWWIGLDDNVMNFRGREFVTVVAVMSVSPSSSLGVSQVTIQGCSLPSIQAIL